MTTKLTFKSQGETLTGGDPYDFNHTLTKDGATYNLTGFTVTASIKQVGEVANIAGLADIAVTIVSAAAGTVKLPLTQTLSALLVLPPAGEDFATILHACDYKVVESGTVDVHSEGFTFTVRRPIT